MHTIEYLIDFTIIEIEHPLNQILETPTDNVSEPDDFSEEVEFNSKSKEMEENNDHEEE
jgi:hypothetical protein